METRAYGCQQSKRRLASTIFLSVRADLCLEDRKFETRTPETRRNREIRNPKPGPEDADRKIRDRKMETGTYRCRQSKRRLASIYFSVLNFFCHSVFGFRISLVLGCWSLVLLPSLRCVDKRLHLGMILPARDRLDATRNVHSVRSHPAHRVTDVFRG
jgi:hypothetical protein